MNSDGSQQKKKKKSYTRGLVKALKSGAKVVEDGAKATVSVTTDVVAATGHVVEDGLHMATGGLLAKPMTTIPVEKEGEDPDVSKELKNGRNSRSTSASDVDDKVEVDREDESEDESEKQVEKHCRKKSLDEELDELVIEDFDVDSDDQEEEEREEEEEKEEEQGEHDTSLKRDEVFSPHYRLSSTEAAEIKELEHELGINWMGLDRLGGLLAKVSSPRHKNKKEPGDNERRNSGRSKGSNGACMRVGSMSSVGSKESITADWDDVVHPDGGKTSYLLKRGDCMMMNVETNDFYECLIYLFTRGIVIAEIKGGKPTFLTAIQWDDVVFVGIYQMTAIKIEIVDEEYPLIITFGAQKSRHQWLCDIRVTVTKYHLFKGTRSDLGWQYRYVYRPGFTLAVTEMTDPLISNQTLSKKDLNRLDGYSGYAPLHYAVRCGNYSAIETLLEAGADPNVRNKDNLTPMYYAEVDDLPKEIADLLRKYGAEESQDAQLDKRGELFGRVEGTQQTIQRKKELAELEQQIKEERAAERKRQAETARVELQNTMNKMRERGELIEEMDNKARALNEGAEEYSSMAKQLKLQTKKKAKSWFP